MTRPWSAQKVVESPSTDAIVEDFGCEPTWSPVPSEPPGTLLRRTAAIAESSLVAWPTAGSKPVAACEWALDVLRAAWLGSGWERRRWLVAVRESALDVPRVALPGSGWERPLSLATGSKFETVRWERTESPAPAVSQEPS